MGVGSAIAQDQISTEAAENAKRLTVMINATIDGDTRLGAGIIFAVANDQVYIATADHLVRRGTSNASDIRVEFKWLPGQPQLAELLTWDYPSLDLAVVVVDSGKAHTSQTSLPFDRLGDPTKITANSALWAIGYPNGAAYDMSPGQLSQREALRLTYRTLGVVPGCYSGGPLVDRNGLIVGMVRQDQPPNTEATRMDLLIEQLTAKDFPIALRQPGSGPPVTNTNPLRSRNPPEQTAPTPPLRWRSL
jgi:S1-C subfamily serine protease